MKGNAPLAVVTEFLGGLFALRADSVERLNEGLESHAFRFDDGHESFVLRIGSSPRGFEKTAGRRRP